MRFIRHLLIWVILVGLAFIAGVHLYRAYQRKVQAQLAEEQTGATQTFHQVPISHALPEPEMPVYKRFEDAVAQDIFLEDIPLTGEAQQEQARQTVKSILADFQDNEAVRAFSTDVLKATGQPITLTDLSGENLTHLLKQYPQLQEVMAQHAKDPQFAQALQEIFSNPQFMYSVSVLQNHPAKASAMPKR